MIWISLGFAMLVIGAMLGWIKTCWNHPDPRKAIIERAERQHRQWMAGDVRGFYGEYPPVNISPLSWLVDILENNTSTRGSQ
jgi:hypothetical protein